MVTKERLEEVLDGVEDKISHLECDGASRVIANILHKANIPFQIFKGKVIGKHGQELIPLHFWIVADSWWYVDFKLNMWLDKDFVQEGILSLTEKQVTYEDVQLVDKEEFNISDSIFRILLNTEF